LQESAVNSAESTFLKNGGPPKIGGPMRPHRSHSAKAGTAHVGLILALCVVRTLCVTSWVTWEWC